MICPYCTTDITSETQSSMRCRKCIDIHELEDFIIYHKNSKITGHSIYIKKVKHKYLIMTLYNQNETNVYHGVYNSTYTPLTKLKGNTMFTPSNAKQKLQIILTFL